MTLESLVGASPESLTLQQRWELVGHWVALEFYTPQNLALRIIEAIGRTPDECIAMLRSRGLDPERFELTPLAKPY